MKFLRFCGLGALVVLAPLPSAAQLPDTSHAARPAALAAADSVSPVAGACTYAACAIRIERPRLGLGRTRLVRGERDIPLPVERVGSFRVAPLLGTSPDARPHALRQDRLRLDSDVVGGAATLLSAVSLLAGDGIDRDSRAALAGGTLVLGFLSRFLAREADRALSRAVWWYNRDLAEGRGPVPPRPGEDAPSP